MYTYTTKLIYWQLLLWGVHIGHSFKNSIIFSSWLVYTYRQNILIINLFKTIWLIKNGYTSLTAAVKLLGPIWFINLNKNIELFTIFSAKQAGEFSYTCHWMHGMISNWITFGLTFQKFNRVINSANKAQFSKLEWDWHPWLESRISWPRVTFISSVSSSPWATKECLTSAIPCLGIIDTNISGHLANLAIPGNDDSLDSLIFYNTHISQYILEKKFNGCTKWFFNIRRHKRIFNFTEWIFINYINENGLFNKNKLVNINKVAPIKNYKNFLKSNNNLNISSFWHFGLKYYFLKNFGLFNFKEQVDIFDSNLVHINWNLIITKIKNYSVYLTKLLNIFFIKTTWKNKQFIKKHIFKFKILKLKFLTGYYNYLSKDWRGTNNYFYQRFLTGRIYKTYLKSSKYRFNKFILTFIKYFFLNKFILYRGWWSNYSLNLINKSKLSYVSLFYCSSNFKNSIFNNLKKTISNFNFKILKKPLKINNKKLILNYKIYINLNKILKSNYINKYKKFIIYYKNHFNLLKLNTNKLINIYYLFFFNFFLWNNLLKKNKNLTNNLNKRWKKIKIFNRVNLLYLFNNTINKYNKLTLYYKSKRQDITFFKYLKIFKKSNILSFWFINLGLTFDNLNFLQQHINKNLFNNLKTQKYNKKIMKWDKQKKFLYIKNNYWFINIKDKLLWQLYKPYILNIQLKKLILKKLILYNKYYINYKFKNLNMNNIFVNEKINFIHKYKYNFYNMKNNKNNYNNYYFFSNKIIEENNYKLNFKKLLSLNNHIENNYNLKYNQNKLKQLNILKFKNLIQFNNWKFNNNFIKLIKIKININNINIFYNYYLKNLQKYKTNFW